MTSASAPVPSMLRSRSASRGRKVRNHLATGLIVAAVVVALVPLYYVVAFVIGKGGSVFGWSFLTHDPPILDQLSGGGMLPAIVGTLVITGAATAMAVPLGILGAIYLNEYGQRGRLARLIRFLAEIMIGVPSIVMGLFIFTVWVLHFKNQTAFAGTLALGCLMLPIVIRTSEEMLRLVPDELREGSSRARQSQGAHHPHRRPARRRPRNRQRGAARRGPGRRRDRTAAVHHRDRHVHEHQPLPRPEHGPVGPDLPQCDIPVRRRPAARLRGGADPGTAGVHVHGAVPARDHDLRPPIVRCWSVTMDTARVRATPSPATTVAPVLTRPPAERPDVTGDAPAPRPDERQIVFDLAGVEVRYHGVSAVHNVNLAVAAREITAFIGPSGCGKTTVLRSLNRMHDITPGAEVLGRITYHGEDLYGPRVDVAEVRRRIGMVFQKPNPFPKSIHDNVAYGPRINGRKRGELDDLVESALRRAALWDEVKDKLKHSALGLSGGQQQRMCIARALAVEPDVVLMDEPCSALDPIATARIEDLMQELKHDYTLVIVTHNMQQAARASDRTAFFTAEVDDAGRRVGCLVEFDSTEQLFTQPSDQRTEGYITGRFG